MNVMVQLYCLLLSTCITQQFAVVLEEVLVVRAKGVGMGVGGGGGCAVESFQVIQVVVGTYNDLLQRCVGFC